MCGIWAIIGKDAGNMKYLSCINKLFGRGPEGSGYKIIRGEAHLSFSRLAINGLTNEGMQPFTFDKTHVVCNGEIYNWRELAAKYNLELKTGSDCEILQLINAIPASTLFNEIDGVFGIVIYNEETKRAIIARDPYGVRPLYMWLGKTNGEAPLISVSSELKGFDVFKGMEGAYSPVMPGHYMQIDNVGTNDVRISIVNYHSYPFKSPHMLTNGDAEISAWCKIVQDRIVNAVDKRVLTTERPIAALLSGGVDSSLIAALVQDKLCKMDKPPLKTFSIGFEGSKDLEYARKVAQHIGADHNEIIMTPDDFFNAIPEVIKVIESYDITTVRASVGNYLVAKEVAKRCDAKVVFNGDGADELFGSYLYFFRAPDFDEYDDEVRRLLADIHYFDVLRSDRSISSNGLEPRTPFLDKSVVEAVLSVPTVIRKPTKDDPNNMEKALLRYSFIDYKDVYGNPILPREVLFRRKEAFSDGVSGPDRPWYEEIKNRLPEGKTEEEYYRELYDVNYKKAESVNCPYKWLPKWSGETTDPSARTLSIY
jgi:asparagine synthase (glutamine-hydrolysing)